MKRCRNVVWIFWMIVGACVLAAPAQASLIQNGDFEQVSGSTFTGWTYMGTGASVENSSVISGTYSAEIVGPIPTGSGLIQSFTEQLSSFVFECDFAVFPVTSNRSMNILLYYHPTDNRMINLRVGPNNILQAYNGSAWQNLGSLTALTTADTGTPGVWDGETPKVNHLMVLGYLSPTGGSSYDVILNGVAVSGVSHFQGGAPDSTYYTIYRVALQGTFSDKNWLVDNVVFMRIPEPSTGVLLGVGGLLGLAGLFWRRRRQKPLPPGRFAGMPCPPE